MIETDAKRGSSAPHLATDGEGLVVLSWLEPKGEGTALRFSVFEREAWTLSRTVATGSNWFVNWADFPSVTPISPTQWAAHWLVRRPVGGFAYDVEIARSIDAGNTWSESEKPHHDGTPSEHGFVSLVPYQDEVIAVWLDGRQMVGEHHESHEKAAGGMTLRSASAAMGKPFQKFHLVDDLVCDCCQTDAVVTPSGPVVVYRDRTDEEIRDIYVTRFLDGAWTEGISVHQDGWEIGGCPVNGPAVAMAGDQLAVAWFTGAADVPRVKVALANADGLNFEEPVQLDDGNPAGRVDVLGLSNGDFLVTWLERTGGENAEVRMRRVRSDGTISEAVTLTSSSSARASGFPRLAQSPDGSLVMAWTDVSTSPAQVRITRIYLEE
jgi:hypothetical protein